MTTRAPAPTYTDQRVAGSGIADSERPNVLELTCPDFELGASGAAFSSGIPVPEAADLVRSAVIDGLPEWLEQEPGVAEELQSRCPTTGSVVARAASLRALIDTVPTPPTTPV